MQVNATPSLSHMEVVCDMPGLTSRAGSALLTGLAGPIGLPDGLVRGLSVRSRKVRHEPGRAARELAVMLADGGDCLSDQGVCPSVRSPPMRPPTAAWSASMRACSHAAWLELVLMGNDLLAWMKEAAALRQAARRLRTQAPQVPPAARCRAEIVLHAGGVKLRPPRTWPWAPALASAFARASPTLRLTSGRPLLQTRARQKKGTASACLERGEEHCRKRLRGAAALHCISGSAHADALSWKGPLALHREVVRAFVKNRG